MTWVLADLDGRNPATLGDCVCRAVAIVEQRSYRDVWTELAAHLGRMPERGIDRDDVTAYMQAHGWTFTSLIGPGIEPVRVGGELPAGRLVVLTGRHAFAVIDGLAQDVTDPAQWGSRIYGYWKREGPPP